MEIVPLISERRVLDDYSFSVRMYINFTQITASQSLHLVAFSLLTYRREWCGWDDVAGEEER